ncbi:MAG: phage holin family protein [Porticoccaceae bacterium]
MNYDAFILITRLAIHVATAILLASYFGTGYRYRPVISLTAAIMAGSSAALAMQIATLWDEMLSFGANTWATVFSGAVLFVIARARGNVAKLFEFSWKWHG